MDQFAMGMTLALNFYAGTDTEHSNDANIVRQCNHLVKSQEALQKRQMLGHAIDEVHAWIDKALELIDPYVGECFRLQTLDLEMINIHQTGSIIQWNRLKSAFQVDKGVDVAASIGRHPNYNVIFKIYSQTGKNIDSFKTAKDSNPEIVFPVGSQFLVCKKEFDQKSNFTIIYLREVVTGSQENIVMWVDEQIFSSLDPQLQFDPSLFQESQFEKCIAFTYSFHYQFNVSFILKSNMTLASAYLQSDLFKKQYPKAKKFKFIINYCI